MINTHDLEKTIALTLYSGYVKGERPASLMIVSDRPEAGKTETLAKFNKSERIAYLTDATAYGLWRDFHQQIARGVIRHILIPEFLVPISRGKATVDSFITTIGSLIEEGFAEIHTGFLKPIALASPVTVGVIACLPRAAFNANKMLWEVSGFLSRFMVVSFSHDDSTIDKVFESIMTRDYLEETRQDLLFPEQSQGVEISRSLASKCVDVAKEITAKAVSEGKLYGYREAKNILRMVAANVVLESMASGAIRTEAKESDFVEVRRLAYLFNEEYNPLKEVQ